MLCVYLYVCVCVCVCVCVYMTQERYAVACFLEPNFEAVVECLPQCCTPER